MVRITAPFLLGVAVGRTWGLPPNALYWSVLPFAALFLVLAVRRTPFDQRWTAGAALALSLFQLGAWRASGPDRPRQGPPANKVDWLMEVDGVQRRTARSVQLRTSTVACLRGAGMLADRRSVLLTTTIDTTRSTPGPGDLLVCRTALRGIGRVPDPGGFDRAGWLRSQGITHEAFVRGEEVRVIGHHWHWTELFASSRAWVRQRLVAARWPERERALAQALLIGSRDDLDRDQRDAFARSGTMHVLAVSGMHVGIIYLLLSTMMGVLGRTRIARLVRAIALLLMLWGYAGLTGAGPSVLRATVICSLFVLADVLGSRVDPINSLFAAAFLLLAYDPLMMGQLSFQLSFLAVSGIVLFYRPIVTMWSPDNWILRQAWRIVSVSMAAQLTTLPLTLLVFGAFPTWFLPANIVVVALVPLSVFAGLAAVVLQPLHHLGPLVNAIAILLLRCLDRTTDLFASLPAAYPAVRIDGPQAVVLLTGACLLAAVIAWRSRWTCWGMGLWAVVFLGLWWRAAERSADRVQFTLLDERSATGAVMQVGGGAMAFLDAVDSTARTMHAVRVRRYASAMAVRHLLAITDLYAGDVQGPGPLLVSHGRWLAPGVDVLFTDGDTDLPVDLSDVPDAIVLKPPGAFDPERLYPVLRAGARLVLSPALDGLQRWKVRQWCARLDLRVHDVDRDGAFIFVPDDRGPRSLVSH
ncbi:MAG: ComEC/Rec2 family competence protein [Flavobacteriales bacterium]|nr:ComEC/Rec2 family competence protein [Flavobacteriales bacterium]